MNEVIIPFTYADLPAPVAAELQAVTSRIKDRLIRQVTDILETGRDLLDVKSKLQHGQFESWLNLSFNMTVRTAQKYMRAAEWMADKSELGSVLTPTSVYLLSAKSTPEGVHEKVVERLGKGLPAEPEYVRMVVQEAKNREREAKNRKGKRESRSAREQREARWERLRLKEEEERQRIETAAAATACQVADILANKLSDDELQRVSEVLGGDHLTRSLLPAAIAETQQRTDKKPSAYAYECLSRAWNAASEDEQGRFLVHIGWTTK